MAELAERRCRDVKGQGCRGAEHGGARADVLDIVQDAGTEEDAGEGGGVGAEGLLVGRICYSRVANCLQ